MRAEGNGAAAAGRLSRAPSLRQRRGAFWWWASLQNSALCRNRTRAMESSRERERGLGSWSNACGVCLYWSQQEEEAAETGADGQRGGAEEQRESSGVGVKRAGRRAVPCNGSAAGVSMAKVPGELDQLGGNPRASKWVAVRAQVAAECVAACSEVGGCFEYRKRRGRRNNNNSNKSLVAFGGGRLVQICEHDHSAGGPAAAAGNAEGIAKSPEPSCSSDSSRVHLRAYYAGRQSRD